MKKLILLIFGILLLNLVSASIDIRIDVNQGFIIGEKVNFDYTFISDTNEEITYTPKIKCAGGYESLLADETITLIKGVRITKNYEDFEITKELEKQQCLAIIKIKAPFIKVKEEVFEIVTYSDFSFNIKICKDSSCKEKTSVFLKNENPYISYFSSVENPSISASLIYPDGLIKSINLPTTISGSQIGTYELEVTVSKQGYKTATEKVQFGVIAKQAEIKYAPEIISRKESSKIIYENKFEILGFLILIILIIIAVIIVLIYYKKKRKAKNL